MLKNIHNVSASNHTKVTVIKNTDLEKQDSQKVLLIQFVSKSILIPIYPL